MIHFKTLRISGFKSFVDKTDLDIGQGLTGIVGPNGCGKSNLVEALRWAMGESSAKKMRGGGMEDVIFSGTARRPARNFAEVTLLLDNASRSAPAPYNKEDEIEIIRKIVRDQGSAYKINGRPARARDVQLLFADTLSGANSPALVSQGKVASIINAKPHERRMILEESAGISGLYARRHEAELRLKQAEQNLTRLEDMTNGMETRLQTLKRQARQAQKYKTLNTEIRKLDRLIAFLEWRIGEDKLKELEKEFDAHEQEVSEQLITVTQLNKTYLTQSQNLPKLREEEANSSAELQNVKLACQRIDDQQNQITLALRETKNQRLQVEKDIEHTEKSLDEQQTTLARMDEEQEKIILEDQNSQTIITSKKQTLNECEKNVTHLEERYNLLTSEAAAIKSRRQSLEEETKRLEKVCERQRTKLNEYKAKKNTLQQSLEEQTDFQNKQALQQNISQEIKELQEQEEGLQNNLDQLDKSLLELQSERQKSHEHKTKITSEIDTLKVFIDSFNEENTPPVLNEISVESGFEEALSRALGDTLLGSLEHSALIYWQVLNKSCPDLPATLLSLKDYVQAPSVLDLALSQIGVVSSQDQGKQLASALQPGQALVSKDGAYWRWDGLCIKSEATDRQALYLKQKNRLETLYKELPQANQSLTALQQAISEKEQIQSSKRKKLKETIELSRHRQQSWQELDKELASISMRRESLERELRSLNSSIDELQKDLNQSEEALHLQKNELSEITSNSESSHDEQLNVLKTQLHEARQELQNAISTLERLQQQHNTRQARLRALADERVTLQNRIIRGQDHLKSQQAHQQDIQHRLQDLSNQPQNYDKERQTLLTKMEDLEKHCHEKADELVTQENAAKETARALKEAESSLSKSREARARAQALFDAAKQSQTTLIDQVEEKFECSPAKLLEGLSMEIAVPEELPAQREHRQKLIRDRESIGAVNLQAESELQELEKELGAFLHEKNDLLAAIDELRSGIRQLNSEARERLNMAFEHVNAHFQSLFKRLFSGGQAHLSLIDSDDPLDSGLEIFAQPPGKALQALSLMSGGEQTLASIALIFAMFLTNPAPICVLDEIDAPLDDANVDKVCDLLEEIAETTKTRFLVITHHRLTMARMDRIYGVTMAEKGISQLVSIDLQQSFSFLEEAA